jgi:glutamate racemase
VSATHKRIIAIDSGIGGLSVVASLLGEATGGISVTYLADLVNLPYGGKSAPKIKELTTENLTYLLNSVAAPCADLILIACNTIFAQAGTECNRIGNSNGIPVCGVIRANCLDAVSKNSQRIVVVGTEATIESRVYRHELEGLGVWTDKIIEVSCPLFVPLIEEKMTAGPALEWIVKYYLSPVIKVGDSVILGCTHYTYILDALRRIYPDVYWIKSGRNLLEYEPAIRNLFLNRSPYLAQNKNRLEILVTGRGLDLPLIDDLDLSHTEVNINLVTSTKPEYSIPVFPGLSQSMPQTPLFHMEAVPS